MGYGLAPREPGNLEFILACASDFSMKLEETSRGRQGAEKRDQSNSFRGKYCHSYVKDTPESAAFPY